MTCEGAKLSYDDRMSKEDIRPQDQASLQNLYLVLLQTIEVLEPYASAYPAIDKHLAEARAICNDLKIELGAGNLEVSDTGNKAGSP
jgi:hypothetical protein